MAASGKRFGGIKPAAAGVGSSKPRTSSPLSRVRKRMQVIAAEVLDVATEALRDRSTEVPDGAPQQLLFADEDSEDGWNCPYGCLPTKTSQGVVHHWQCEYWSQEGKDKTPFDRRPK